MIDVKRIWKQGLALGGGLLLCGCTIERLDSDGGGDVDDPPTPCDGQYEVEPNDTPREANYLGWLPVLSPETACGDYMPFAGVKDVDHFFFYLNPKPGVTTVKVNLSILTDPQATPVLKLSQSLYDTFGNPTGDYFYLGTFYGQDGELLVIDFPVAYDFLYKNDLFLEVSGLFSSASVPQYEIQYWY